MADASGVITSWGTTRTFLKVGSAVGAVSALVGLDGILAARRAPAYAQGTKLHLLHWVDFVPEGDVELKRRIAQRRPVSPRVTPAKAVRAERERR